MAAKENENALEDLIAENRAWILKTASQVVGRYVTDSDDVWSIALLAFHDAVRDYNESKGAFRTFAGLVIRRRVLDYQRAESRHASVRTVSPDVFNDGVSEETDGTAQAVKSKLHRLALSAASEDASADARDEIGRMQAILAEYGFSFFDLAESAPRAEKTKKNAAAAVSALLNNPELMRKLRRNRRLPTGKLSSISGAPAKTLDRHRKYVIAAAEILAGDYPVLSSYLRSIRGR